MEFTLSGISRTFRAVQALSSVDYRLLPGSVHALLGENGAGKSTLMRIAFGLLRPDSGQIAVNGTPMTFRSPRDAVRAGIGMVQQHFSLVPALSVAENVAMGGSGRYKPAEAAERVRRIALATGFDLDPFAKVADLSIEGQQRVEVLRALARDAQVLILDEPTAVLAPGEVTGLLEWIRRFASTGGSVALVTHKVRDALRIADEITVLRGGHRVAHGPTSDFTERSLAHAMFPAAHPSPPLSLGKVRRQAGRVVATVAAVAIAGDHGQEMVRDATFTLHAGEVVGLLGVDGSGHAELLRALAGLRPVKHGTLAVQGSVAFVPADRYRDAIVPEFPLFENFALRRADALAGWMDWRAYHHRTAAVVREFDIHTPSDLAPAATLSGGNQQRFVLGRELSAHPDLLIAENPTRGLDLQAMQFVLERLGDAAAAGAAVLVYSSDIDEVLGLADRVLVACQGTVREVAPERELVERALVGVQ